MRTLKVPSKKVKASTPVTMEATLSLSTSICSNSLLSICVIMAENPFPAQQVVSSPFLLYWSSADACFSKSPQLHHQERLINLELKSQAQDCYNPIQATPMDMSPKILLHKEALSTLLRTLSGLKPRRCPMNHRISQSQSILLTFLWTKFKLSSTKEIAVNRLRSKCTIKEIAT